MVWAMASGRRSARAEPTPVERKISGLAAATAAALLLAAPVVSIQAAVNADVPVPRWAREWSGFRLAEEARGRLSGDPQTPAAGLTLGPGAADLARAAYAREPLASQATFVLALAESPLIEDYRAGPVARLGAALDKRNALLRLLLIADAAGREDYPAMFGHADVLAAAHPDLARTVLAPVFERLGDPATVPLVAAALAAGPRWAPAFRGIVPQDEAALGNYLTLRAGAGWDKPWESDERLVATLADRGFHQEAFAAWRGLAGARADAFGFAAGPEFAPIGWRSVQAGDRVARVGEDGSMFVSVERGAGGELASRLLQLPPGRYRLEATIASDRPDPPLWVALRCAKTAGAPERRPLTPQVELVAEEAGCPAYWLIVGASALDSRHRVEATLGNWRFSRIE